MLKTLIASAFLLNIATQATEFKSSWYNDPDRTWAGKEYWGNRLHDWQVSGGRLICTNDGYHKNFRTLQLMPYRLTELADGITTSVEVERIAGIDNTEAMAGFIFGIGSKISHLKASLSFGGYGPDNGIFAGMRADRRLVIIDMANGKTLAVSNTAVAAKAQIKAHIMPSSQGKADLKVSSADTTISVQVPAKKFAGNLALTSHTTANYPNVRYAFSQWSIKSQGLKTTPIGDAGPIISAQHTLSRGILKMTAQLAPVFGNKALLAGQNLEKAHLQIRHNNQWQTIDSSSIVVPGFTAHFKVSDWQDTKDVAYRIVFKDIQKKGHAETALFEGTIKADPRDKKAVKVAAFTGNHNLTSWRGANIPADEAVIAYPHNDLYSKALQHKADLYFWSGDQVYEGSSPSYADKSGNESSYYDYLYKWYLWCLSVRDITREYPCVVLPDDHDVFQGNIWGAGGKKSRTQDDGGYQMPAEWVKMIERTQSSHHPDPFDTRPIGLGLKSYYTDMVYGRISFAILEDRKYKKGPRGTVVPMNQKARADHVTDPTVDTRTFDKPGLTLLGDRQLKFLNHWSSDWRGADMKCVLTQSVFANMATHHGPGAMRGQGFLVADFDSNGWPQSGRNKALREIRRAYAFTIGGDQHLASIVQHGIDEWNDCGYAFTVPSIANFYPRAWLPKKKGGNHIDTMPYYTGEHFDSFKNKVTVWAVNNPGKSSGFKPAIIHDKMPGYGIVTFQKDSHDIKMECWPRYADPAKAEQMYNGWPKTVNASENYGRQAFAYLPTIQVKGLHKPVVQVIDQKNNEVLYTLRIQGHQLTPKVFRQGLYTIRIGDPDSNSWQEITDQKPAENESISINF